MRDNNRMPVELEGGSGRAVLIVEDSENSAAMLEMAFLGIPGVSVMQAASGVEALRILNAAATPIIVVSADTDPATPERVAALGVDAFFPKPFSPAQVRRTLEQLLNGTKH